MELTVVGVPASAGTRHAGQELTPAALRSLGLVEVSTAAGLDVEDAGDVEGEVFRAAVGSPSRSTTRAATSSAATSRAATSRAAISPAGVGWVSRASRTSCSTS